MKKGFILLVAISVIAQLAFSQKKQPKTTSK